MPPKILFTAWNAYSAVNPTAGTAVGGLETGAWSIAKKLAESGEFEILFGVRVPHLPDADNKDQPPKNVTLVYFSEPLRAIRNSVSQRIRFQRSYPWVKLKQWSNDLIWKVPLLALNRLARKKIDWNDAVLSIMQQQRPNLIFSLGVNQDTSAAVNAARQENIPNLIWLQSNGDVDSRFLTQPDYIDRYAVSAAIVNNCLNKADLILCQTEHQQRELQQFAQTPSVVVRQPIDTHRFHPQGSTYAKRHRVLWIGRYDRFHKRPLLALEVAHHCPEIPFTFVINQGDEEVLLEFKKKKPENVTLIDYIPNSNMPDEFRQSRIFMSTGSREHEGFPNVFLEAAASGTPVCTLENFDNFIERSHAGTCGHGDMEQLKNSVRNLWHDEHHWNQASSAGTDHVRQHHSLDAVVTQFETAIHSLQESTWNHSQI